eukprot:symbB.v1.2.022693.t1/scaffold2012.1/size92363/4
MRCMMLELPLELLARVIFSLLTDVTNTTLASSFPRADEQSCRLGFKTLAATSQTCLRNKRAICLADLWSTLAENGSKSFGLIQFVLAR